MFNYLKCWRVKNESFSDLRMYTEKRLTLLGYTQNGNRPDEPIFKVGNEDESYSCFIQNYFETGERKIIPSVRLHDN